MLLHLPSLDSLRARAKNLRAEFPDQWEASRRAVTPAAFPTTLAKLRQAITETLATGPVREALLGALSETTAGRVFDLPTDALRAATGLPATKAVRALCVLFGVTNESRSTSSDVVRVTDSMVASVQTSANPFELLLQLGSPSLLDLGAGDLSFVEALCAATVPAIRARGRSLTVHAVDRIQTGSSLGEVYQVPPDRLRALETMDGLHVRYWNNIDMLTLAAEGRPRALFPHYDLVTCWAPANPTFAYEPTRLSPAVIREDLERTRGSFREIRARGERALEVQHQGRALLFPPWKFDVRGPAALLDLMTRLGTVLVLGAVDGAVFWEVLAQVLADPAARPRDVLFTSESLPTVFGPIFERLNAMRPGDRLFLGDIAPLRSDLARVIPGAPRMAPPGLRYVEIRRGATFPGMPASLTAQRYAQMTEEPTPWFVLLIPR